MEYKYLAHLTGRSEYFEKVGVLLSGTPREVNSRSQVEAMMDMVVSSDVADGAFPTRWGLFSGKPASSE